MTTSVGSIRLDLEIDGTAVPAEIQAAVTRALEPVLANIERRLNEIEREYGQAARAGEKSGSKQTAAAKVVAEAVEKIGDEQVKTAAKTETSTRAQTRSINAVTRALEKQSLATEKATAAQLAYNAAVRAQPSPNYSPPPGTPRSGGGGVVNTLRLRDRNTLGGGRGGRGGGFFGIGGPVTGALGWNGVAAVVGSFPAAATAVVNLTGAVQQLGQAGLVLPGIFAGIASSVGTAVIGFQGMGDAITALADAAKSGDLKDLEKANEALKDLAPSAQATAKAIATSVIPAFKDLQKNFVAQPMFEGLDQTITTLATRSMPTLQKGLGGIATAWNQTFKQLGITLGSDSSQGLLDRIFGNTAEAQTRLNNAIEPLVHGFGSLAAKGTEFLPRLADGITAVSTRFDNWISKSVENGNLDKWINEAFEGVGHLGESFLNVGKILTSLTKAAGGDGGFLKWLDEASGKLATFLSSDDGQAKLTKFFDEGKEQLRQWAPIIGNVATAFGQIYEASKQWSAVLLPVLESVTDVLTAQPDLIGNVVTAFLAWKTISGVSALVTSITGVGTALDALPGKATGAAGGISKAFSLIAIPAIAKTISDQIDQWLKDNHPDLYEANHTNTPGDLGKQARDAWDAWYEEHILGQGPFGEGHTLGPLGGGPNASRERRGLAVPPPLNFDDLPNVVTGQGPVPGMTPASLPTLSGLLTGKNNQLPPVPGQSPMSPDISALAPLDLPDLPKQIEIPVTAPGAVQAAQDVNAVGQAAEGLPAQKTVTVDADTRGALAKLQGVANLLASIQSKTISIGVNAPTTGSVGGTAMTPSAMGGKADGGVFPGYAPGVDSILSWVSPGEGVLIPEAVRGLGGSAAIYAINSMFRKGLSRQGYADGGVIGDIPGLLRFGGGGVAPPMGGPAYWAWLLKKMPWALNGGTDPSDILGPAYGSDESEWVARAVSIGGHGPNGELEMPPLVAGLRLANSGLEDAAVPGEGLVQKIKNQQARDSFDRLKGLEGSMGSSPAPTPSDLAILAAQDDELRRMLAQLFTRASGGVFPGYAPGVDSILSWVSPGEGVLIPEAVRALGGAQGIYAINSMFRKGLSRQGYSDGGVVGGVPSGLSPMASDIVSGLAAALNPMLQILTQIRDSLGGRGATSAGYTDTVLASTVPDLGGYTPPGGMMTAAQAGDYKNYPLGDPRRIMAGVMSGIGMPADEIAVALGGNMLSAAGGPVSDIVGDIATNVLTTPLPGQIGTPTNPSTDLNTLVQQRNPLALAQAAGFDVPDYTRAGGGPQDIMRNTGPASDAMGRMYSDTASLVDRTFTNLDAAEKARHDQTMTVLNEVKDRLGKDGLVPVLKEGVADGMGAMADKTTAAIGTSLGAAAGPPIASAVQSAIPSGGGAAPGVAVPAASDPTMGGGGLPPSAFHSFGSFTGFEGGIAFGNGGILGGLYDEGGLWPSGTFGTNLSGRPERVLSPEQTEAFEKGLLGGWNLYPLQQHMATVSGVDVTDQVGADFFGVSQVPILGALVNLLVMVLLRVIGVQIEARDTLDEISSDFRAFRGEFQAFDAAGRMMNDTSGLMDRTGSSEQAAADERVRILKLVLEGLIKFIIEKIIVPVGKAVANAAIQAGATAANGAITGGLTAALPTGGSVIGGMVGSVVSGAITAGGSAAVDIIADIGAKLGEAALSVLIDASGELLQGMLPNLTKFLFGGKFIAGIADSFTGALSNIMGGIGGVFAGLLGGIADLWPFDDGGIANGMGWLPKATVAPERVLSPRQTEAFEQMVAANFGNTTAGYNRTVHAPMTVIQAGPNTAHEIKDRLVSALS